MAYFWHGAIFVVSSNFDDNTDAARAVSFIGFFKKGSSALIGHASDRALNVGFRHVGEARLLEYHREGRVHRGIGTTTCRNGNLVPDFCKQRTALRVYDGFLALGGCPFAVSAHDCFLVI